MAVAGLTVSTATTVFLVAFGESLGFEVTLFAGGSLPMGLSYIFSGFILVASFLGFLAGVSVTSFLVYTAMSERVRDVGIMKATGSTADTAFSYFLTELSIVVFTSCTVGTLLGVLAQKASVSILNLLGFQVSQNPLNPWVLLIIFVAFVLVSHVLGVRPIKRASEVQTAEALSPTFFLEKTPRPLGPTPSRLGLTFKIAYRSLLRRRSATLRAIACLSVVLTLTTVATVGGAVANRTTQSYAERAIGRNVILIGHPDLAEQYVSFLSQAFEEAEEIEPIDSLAPKYLINESLTSELNSILEDGQLDPRLVLATTVHEVPGYIIDPEEPGYYIKIGDERSHEALVIGVDPRRVVNDWLTLGRFINETDQYTAVIGDSLAAESFQNPQKQEVKILGEDFEIAGVCLDPLNKGYVAYVPLETLSTLVNRTGYNLLFLRIDPSKRPETVSYIEGVLSETDFELRELNEVLDKHIGFLNRLWSLVMFLPLLSLVTAVLCLLSYTMLSVTGEQRELGIMRALGAKPGTILKIVLTETSLLVLISGAIGITAGTLVTWLFLIPEPVISPLSLALTFGWLLLALVVISLTSLYPAIRVAKQPVAKIVSEPP